MRRVDHFGAFAFSELAAGEPRISPTFGTMAVQHIVVELVRDLPDFSIGVPVIESRLAYHGESCHPKRTAVLESAQCHVDLAATCAGVADDANLGTEFSLADGKGGEIAVQPTIPAGEKHNDEYFGDVEIFHTSAEVTLQLQRATDRATLVATSQGCADAGVCYPPSRQKLVVPVPAADGKPGPLIEASPARKRLFN